MTRRLALSLLLTGLMAMSRAAPAQTPAVTPENLPQVYANAMAARNVDAIAALYAERAVLMTPEGAVVSGRDQIKALITRNLAAGPVRMTVAQARRQGDPGHALIVMDWTLEIAPPGRDPIQRRVRSMLYLRNIGSAWQIVADMYQIIPPG